MKILDIFPTKILGESLKDISIEEINFYKDFILNKCKYIESNNLVKHTENQQLLDLPLFNKLKTNVLKYSKLYLDNLYQEYKDIQIVCSWANIISPKGITIPHHHNNSYLSGVFYFDHNSPIIFEKPNNNNFYSIKLDPKPNKPNPNFFEIPSEPNLLIIFPSELRHVASPPKLTTRCSIAFNIIPKGKFGAPTSQITL